MTIRRHLVAALMALWALLALPAEAADRGRLLQYDHVFAAGLPEQRLTIWLPPGYDKGVRRYPVVYMHDGHNLFDRASSNFGKIWEAERAMLAAMKRGAEPHIIVGIWAPGVDRYRQYLPASAYRLAAPDIAASMAAAAGGPILSDAYLDWLAGPLKSWVDATLRTRPGRNDTVIMGSSMGGLMSCYAFLERPAVYGRAACVSSHWPAVAPGAVGDADPRLIALWDGWFAARLGPPDGRRLWMDHGTATLDAHYAPYQQAIDARLAASGWERGREWQSRVYDGAPHDENAWAARLPEIFLFLMAPR